MLQLPRTHERLVYKVDEGKQKKKNQKLEKEIIEGNMGQHLIRGRKKFKEQELPCTHRTR